MANWTQADTVKLAHLLATSPLIDTLEDRLPELGGITLEDSAMSSRERKGAENIIQEIVNLASIEDTAPLKPNFVPGIESFADPAPPLE